MLNDRLAAGRVGGVYRIVPAIRKHVVAQEPLAGGGVGVRVEEALEDRVIISALQVIPARLFRMRVAIGAFFAAFSALQIRKEAAAPGGHFALPERSSAQSENIPIDHQRVILRSKTNTRSVNEVSTRGARLLIVSLIELV